MLEDRWFETTRLPDREAQDLSSVQELKTKQAEPKHGTRTA